MVVKVGWFILVSKPVVYLNDEPAEDDETVEIEECGQMDN